MALDQSALLELLDVMRSADGGELMRRLLATIVQLLVDAEATAFVGAERCGAGVADPWIDIDRHEFFRSSNAQLPRLYRRYRSSREVDAGPPA